MPAWKLVYRIFSRIALPTFLLTGVLTTSGCSDPIQEANEKGAAAQAQLDSGQISAARRTIAAAVAERDDIPELHLLHGRIELQAGSPATAYNAFSAALALDSSNMEALLGVAQLGLQNGHLTESEDATNRLLSLDPRQPNATLLKGLHNMVKRRYEDAAANADAILEVNPGDENAAILKARALAVSGKPDEAFAVVETARKKSGDSISVALTLLEIYRARGDGNSMVPVLERVRQLAPESASYDIDEADTLYKLGEPARARVITRRRMLDRRLVDDQAAAIARLWKEYDPEPFDAAGLADFASKAKLPASKALARLYLDRNDPVRAIAALSAAPYIDDVIALRARAGVAQGKLDASLVQAEKILARDRTHCDALVVKAQVLTAKGRPDAAVSAATLAAATCPQMAVTTLTLAKAQDADGNPAGAMVAFRDGFDRNDQDSGLVTAYAAWLERQGKGSRAVAVVHRLTKNAPSLLSGWKLYSALCARVPDAHCSREASEGLARAQRSFGVDPRSDEPLPTGLFGRLTRR